MPHPNAADVTQGGLTTYVPQGLLTRANARIAGLETIEQALAKTLAESIVNTAHWRGRAEQAEAALAQRDRMLQEAEEGVLRVLPMFSSTTAKLIRRVFAGIRARAGEGNEDE